jgi:hypothetical protein
MAGGMRAAIQEFLGEKFFRDKVHFDDDIILSKTASLYSPIPSEPSLGTPHYKPRQVVAALFSGALTANTWQTITLTGFPTGAKGATVSCWGRTAPGNADKIVWRPYNNGDTVAQSYHRMASYFTQYYDGNPFMVPIDASGRFDIGSNSAIPVFLVEDLTFYWM